MLVLFISLPKQIRQHKIGADPAILKGGGSYCGEDEYSLGPSPYSIELLAATKKLPKIWRNPLPDHMAVFNCHTRNLCQCLYSQGLGEMKSTRPFNLVSSFRTPHAQGPVLMISSSCSRHFNSCYFFLN